MTRRQVFNRLDGERLRQVLKWASAERRVEDPHSPPLWKLAVLGEEFGEVAKALVEAKPDELKAELIHVGAVVVAWLESLDA